MVHSSLLIQSIFLEGDVTDMVTIGLEYAPEAIESPENINAQQTGATDADPSGGTVVTNKASVEYEDITTLYANISLPRCEGSYLKTWLYFNGCNNY